MFDRLQRRNSSHSDILKQRQHFISRPQFRFAAVEMSAGCTSTPSSPRRLIQDRQHSHNLRSATTTLCQPSTTTTFAKRAY